MLSLRFVGSRSGSGSSFLRLCARLAGLVGAAALLGSVACGNSDDGGGDTGGTVALADSGVLAELTTEIGIPTTVAVANGTAWVVESQFDRYVPFGGTGQPAPFRLIGLRLDGASYSEIALPAEFFPEGIAATAGGRLFVGSVRTGSIYTVAPGTQTAVLFANNLKPSTIGMTVGNDNKTLWYCSTDVTVTPPTALVIGIGIEDRAIVGSHELVASAAGSFCNDLVMSPDNALWITESKGGRIFRVAPENLFVNDSAEVWLEDAQLAAPDPATGFGANGITLLGGRLYTVVTDRGNLLAIDPTLTAPTGADLKIISLGSALVKPDGLTRVPDSDTDVLIVESGLGLPQGGRKLLRARLNRL